LTKGLAIELADKKIRVNTVIPGLVQTGLHEKIGKSESEAQAMYDSTGKGLPVGFVATPEHIAEAYLYAVRADYATGSLIQIGENCWNYRRLS
jgi:NAD(P)-dependent dehydrogenase (short-subunit alcohol dehydrogenase family)